MSLIVETGAGLPNAESLASVAAADTRALALGNAAWPALINDVKEQRLRKATDYMRQAYRGRWTGFRVSATQALDWPRWDVMVDGYQVSAGIVPADVVNACIDLAFNANIDALAPDLERGIVREKVGLLETEYDSYAPQTTRYRTIDLSLAPYLLGGGAFARLVRA